MIEQKTMSRKFFVVILILIIMAGTLVLMYFFPEHRLEKETEHFYDAVKPALKLMGLIVLGWMGVQGGRDMIKQAQLPDEIFEEDDNEKD